MTDPFAGILPNGLFPEGIFPEGIFPENVPSTPRLDALHNRGVFAFDERPRITARRSGARNLGVDAMF
jgi:hypothetical protein